MQGTRGRHSELDGDLESLLERGRIVRPVSDVSRARCLIRARTSVGATAGSDPGLTAVIRGHPMRHALAACVALNLVAAAALAALRGWTPHTRRSASAESTVRPSDTSRLEAPPVSAEIVEAPAPIAGPPRRSRFLAPNPRNVYADELDLLQRAQAAFVGRGFADALALLVEHARRFPDGRLAEEREALRIRSLTGCGRADEARRAAAAFAARFPRSVLLPR
jgi:hypothetical protein